MNLAIREVEKLDMFVKALIEHTDLDSTIVLLCSDHGNVEDMSVITHTMNPVPTIVWGRLPRKELASIRSLTDITPFILHCLER